MNFVDSEMEGEYNLAHPPKHRHPIEREVGWSHGPDVSKLIMIHHKPVEAERSTTDVLAQPTRMGA